MAGRPRGVDDAVILRAAVEVIGRVGPAKLTLARSASEMDTPERYTNHLAFLCLDLTDPELHERALAGHEAAGRVIGMLLGEAASAGELAPGTDVAALAGSVQAVITGAGLHWALDRRGTLRDRLARELDVLLSPHVRRKS